MASNLDTIVTSIIKDPALDEIIKGKLWVNVKSDWSDQKFETDYVEKALFDPILQDVSAIPRILKRFWKFYMDGIVDDGNNVSATIAEMVAAAQAGGVQFLKIIYASSAQEVFYQPQTVDASELDVTPQSLPHVPTPPGESAAWRNFLATFPKKDENSWT